MRSLGLALAVVLSPAVLQEDVSCGAADPTALANLEFRPFQMPGQELPEDVLGFEPGVMEYAVELPDSVSQAMVVVEREVESSELSIQCIAGGTIDGHMFDPALPWTMIELPEGDSRLEIVVQARPELGGGYGFYTIHITRTQSDPTALVNLEFRPFQMPGQELPEDVLGFEPGVMEYTVELPDSVREAMVVVEREVESSELSIQCIAGGTIDGHMFDPALPWTMIELPEGDSRLEIVVQARPELGGGYGFYTIHVTRVL